MTVLKHLNASQHLNFYHSPRIRFLITLVLKSANVLISPLPTAVTCVTHHKFSQHEMYVHVLVEYNTTKRSVWRRYKSEIQNLNRIKTNPKPQSIIKNLQVEQCKPWTSVVKVCQLASKRTTISTSLRVASKWSAFGLTIEFLILIEFGCNLLWWTNNNKLIWKKLIWKHLTRIQCDR